MNGEPTEVRHNEFGQPVGPDLPGWHARPVPAHLDLHGTDVRVVDWDQRHVDGLFEATCGPDDGDLWTYMSGGPFRTTREHAAYTTGLLADPAGHPVAVLDAGSERVLGIAAFLRIAPAHGSIEVGSITWGPVLARTRGATEAMHLMAAHAFDGLGYRRYEWKCDSLNAPSRRAAARLGFTHEGTFRNAVVYKGRSRDTAWYSITDAEWPAVRARLEAWLAPENFDEDGRQRSRLTSRSGRAGN
jgi:RimJ/RimL family protein N-acetyltransferase